ncbi:hypothetical protein Tco_1336824 [Tanacetum coccineum]
MLERGGYIPWASHFRRYLNQRRENRKWLNKAIDVGDGSRVGMVLAEWWRRGDDVVLYVGWGGGEGGGDCGGVRVVMLWLWRLWGVAWDGSDGGFGCGGGNGSGGRRRRQICQERGG